MHMTLYRFVPIVSCCFACNTADYFQIHQLILLGSKKKKKKTESQIGKENTTVYCVVFFSVLASAYWYSPQVYASRPLLPLLDQPFDFARAVRTNELRLVAAV